MKTIIFIGMLIMFDMVSSGRLLFRHMKNNGDKEITSCEYCQRHFDLDGTYRFFEESHQSIYLTGIGLLMFDRDFSLSYTPRKEAFVGARVISVFWGGFFVWQTYVLADRLHSDHLWWRESMDVSDLKMAKKIIKKNFGECGKDFVPTHALIVTYQRLASWCDYEWYYDQWYAWYEEYYGDDDYKKRDTQTFEYDRESYAEADVEKRQDVTSEIPQNSLQAVLVTNGTDTYAIFNYHTIEWEGCFPPALMCFNAGDGVRYWSHPDTGKSGLGDALTTGTNVDLAGRWVYKISGENIQDPECNNLT